MPGEVNKEDIEIQYKGLSSSKKVALLMIALGKEYATEIIRYLKEDEIRKISYWISRLDSVSRALTEKVIGEFYSKIVHRTSLSTAGGRDYLMDIFTGVVGEDKAGEVLGKMLDSEESEIFKVLRQVDPKQLAAYLKQEQPQTVALMLSYVEPIRVAAIITALPDEVKIDVIYRLATLEEADPDVVDALGKALTQNLSPIVTGGVLKKMGGIRVVAEVLNNMEDSKAVLEKLSEEDSGLASKIKNLMFVFNDIALLDDKSLQTVLKDIDQTDLVFALKCATPEIKEQILQNLSHQQAEKINDELAFMGKVKSSMVLEAQRRIVNIIMKLEEEGKILIHGRGGEDDVIS